MNAISPLPRRRNGNRPNPYETRWQWWYEAIADWILANPGAPLKSACKVNGGPIDAVPQTIYLVTNTDLFRDYMAARRKEWREMHDQRIVQDSYKLLELSNELVLETMASKRTQVPLPVLLEVRESTLETLGYGAKAAPLVQIDARDQSQQVHVGVTADDLALARQALRRAEDNRRSRSHDGSNVVELSAVASPRVVPAEGVGEEHSASVSVNCEDDADVPLPT